MKVLLGEAHSESPTPTAESGREDLEDNLSSSFQKDGVPATWAPNHPISWGHEIWKFSAGEDGSKTVSNVSCTSDEKYLALAMGDTVVIFSVPDGEENGYKLVSVLKSGGGIINKIRFASRNVRGNGEGYVFVCDYGQAFNGAGREVRVWFLDEECKEGGENDGFVVKGRLPTFAPTFFSNDCETLLYLTYTVDGWGKHPSIVAVEFATGIEKFRMQGHTDQITWVGFSPDDKFIASTAWDKYLKLYSGEGGKLIRDYGPTGAQNWACAFDPEGKSLAVTTGAHSTFMWRIDDPQAFPITLAGKVGWERVIRYSPDGSKLAIGSADGRLMVYETKAVTQIQVWQLGTEDGGSRWLKEVSEIKWLDNGNRICWTPNDGSLNMYDFDSNLKWKWTAAKDDEWRRGNWFNTVVVFEKKGLIGSRDQDGAFRMWKIPG